MNFEEKLHLMPGCAVSGSRYRLCEAHDLLSQSAYSGHVASSTISVSFMHPPTGWIPLEGSIPLMSIELAGLQKCRQISIGFTYSQACELYEHHSRFVFCVTPNRGRPGRLCEHHTSLVYAKHPGLQAGRIAREAFLDVLIACRSVNVFIKQAIHTFFQSEHKGKIFIPTHTRMAPKYMRTRVLESDSSAHGLGDNQGQICIILHEQYSLTTPRGNMTFSIAPFLWHIVDFASNICNRSIQYRNSTLASKQMNHLLS